MLLSPPTHEAGSSDLPDPSTLMLFLISDQSNETSQQGVEASRPASQRFRLSVIPLRHLPQPQDTDQRVPGRPSFSRWALPSLYLRRPSPFSQLAELLPPVLGLCPGSPSCTVRPALQPTSMTLAASPSPAIPLVSLEDVCKWSEPDHASTFFKLFSVNPL